MDSAPPLMDLWTLLESGYRLEMTMAELYQVLASVHHEHETLAALWRKTSREEEHHAAQFRLVLGNVQAMVTEVSAHGAFAQALEASKELLLRYRSNPPSIAEALETTIRLEEEMANLHLDRSCHFRNTPYQRLFEAMMAADRSHIERLREALRAYRR